LTLYVKNLKIGLKPGDPVPKQDPHNTGNVGRYHEELLQSQGLTISPVDIDVPELKLELKTRKNNAVSAFSFCRMTVDEIIQKDFKDSKLYRSIENLLLVRYDNILNIVTSVEVYHWAYEPHIYTLFESSYNDAKKLFLKGKLVYSKKTVVRSRKSFGYFEIDRAATHEDVYEFRITEENLQKLESLKTQVKFNSLFEAI
jgi:hypothetical protein